MHPPVPIVALWEIFPEMCAAALFAPQGGAGDE